MSTLFGLRGQAAGKSHDMMRDLGMDFRDLSLAQLRRNLPDQARPESFPKQGLRFLLDLGPILWESQWLGLSKVR